MTSAQPLVWPMLTCHDARAMMQFLVAVVGFEEEQVIEDAGRIMLAWARLPGTEHAVMLRESHPELPAEEAYRAAIPTGPASIFVRSDDLEEVSRRAENAGARIVRPLRGPEGKKVVVIVDPEGNLWRFGNVLPAPPGPDAVRRPVT